jgi:Flp pilus assembly protein TadG
MEKDDVMKRGYPFGRFCRDRSGVAAIEFAIVAPLFFFVLFASLETAIATGANVLLDNAVENAAREVMTGQTQSSDVSPQAFKDALCADMPIMLSCSKVKVDMRTYPTFDAIPGNVPMQLGNVDSTGFCFNPGAQDNITVVRAFYEWPWVTGFLQKLSEETNGNRVLFSMSAFMNEPFGTRISSKATC